MTTRGLMPRRWLPLAIALLALLALAVLGVQGAMHAWPSAATTGQRVATALQLGYGGFGLVAAIALLAGGPRMRLFLAPWALCVVATAGLAPVVWGGAGWWAGALAAALTALIAWGVVWLAGRSFAGATPQHLPE
jgi:hypothetical protein